MLIFVIWGEGVALISWTLFKAHSWPVGKKVYGFDKTFSQNGPFSCSTGAFNHITWSSSEYRVCTVAMDL